MRKICVVVGSRANYASIKSVMRHVDAHPDLELQLVVGASALLDRFGSVVDVIRGDGFEPSAEVHMIVEGETPVTMAKSTGLGLMELPTVFSRLRPDVVVTVGDRFETMATAIASAYMNIPLAHTMGGEVTGTIDESIRHAITKMAHIHFPASQDAADRIIRMGEDPAMVHVVGCPRLDVMAEIRDRDGGLPESDEILREGVGENIDLERSFLVAAQYPVTTEFGRGEAQIAETLRALKNVDMQTIMLWPNADAGSEDVSRGMRKFREHTDAHHIRFYKNFPVETFTRLLLRCTCMIGNSSAAIREGAFLGTPAVNIGTRQQGRERGRNVIDVPHEASRIEEAIRSQIEHGRYASDPIYGDGHAGKRVADVLAAADVSAQKRICY